MRKGVALLIVPGIFLVEFEVCFSFIFIPFVLYDFRLLYIFSYNSYLVCASFLSHPFPTEVAVLLEIGDTLHCGKRDLNYAIHTVIVSPTFLLVDAVNCLKKLRVFGTVAIYENKLAKHL